MHGKLLRKGKRKLNKLTHIIHKYQETHVLITYLDILIPLIVHNRFGTFKQVFRQEIKWKSWLIHTSNGICTRTGNRTRKLIYFIFCSGFHAATQAVPVREQLHLHFQYIVTCSRYIKKVLLTFQCENLGHYWFWFVLGTRPDYVVWS